MRGAVELLAKEWPGDYPAGAVEWLVVESAAGHKQNTSDNTPPRDVGGSCV
jgi:hypothetical protein